MRFRGSRERALVALLAVNANRVLSPERLVDELWGSAATDGAVRALRVNVSRVRQALGDAGEVLVTHAGGYRLRVHDDMLDSARFDALVRIGRRHAAAGDHQRAASTLREALGLWRGPALVDVAGTPFAQGEAVRLEEGRLAALEERLEADLACGRHSEIVGELEALTRTHALRERLWGQLMICLYRSGRQGEALRAYRALRRTLDEQLGVEPSPALRRLQTSVLRQDPELDWRPAQESRPYARSGGSLRLPEEQFRRASERAPCVGREAERAQLHHWLEAASRAVGTLVMVGGEPGVGKTRLAEELGVEAGAQGMQVFVGHCYEMHGVAPYVAFVEMLESALERAPDPGAFRRALGEEAPEVAKLLPTLRRVCPDIPPSLELPPGAERRLLFNSLRDVLARAARRRPMLLVLDDLHWADEPSLLFVEHLAERIAEIPVLVIATYRDTEVDVGRPLAKTFEDLRRRDLAQWMTLQRLPEAAVADMVGALAGQEAPPVLVRAMFHQTGGNPFFLQEIYRYLEEKGRLFDSDGRLTADPDSDDLDVPAGIRLVVGRRLQRLGEQAPRVLAAAAVIGRAFSVELLEAMQEFDTEVLLRTIEDAERARLIVPAPDHSGEDRFSFAHELVRQALAAEPSLTRRRRLHARAADALERRHPADLDKHAAAIAHHLLEAGANAGPERLFRYLVLAARWASNAAAFEDALEHLERAFPLRFSVPAQECAGFLDDLARARRSTGHWDTAIDAWRQSVDAYERIGDVQALAAVCVNAALSLAFGFRHLEAAQVCRQGLEALADRPSAARARLLDTLGAVLSYGGDHSTGAVLIDQALALATDLGDEDVRGYALFNQCLHHWAWLELQDAVAAGRKAAALLRSSGDLFTVSTALAFGALALVHLGRLDEARQISWEFEPTAKRLGNHLALLMAGRVAGLADFFETGSPERLEAFGRADLEYAARQGLPWVSQGWAWEGVATFLRGDWDLAAHRLREARRHELPGSLNGWDTGQLLENLAYLGERAEALDLIAEALAGLPQPGAPLGWGICARTLAAIEALVVLDEDERAAELYPLTADIAERTAATSGGFYDGRLLQRVAGIAAMAARRWEDSELHFRTALHQARTIPHRPEHAHTCRWYGHMLIRRRGPSDREEARRLIGSAVADYERMGMTRHRQLAADLLI